MTSWTKDQKEALEREGKLLVSASAGSGKTTVMMERVARFLEEGGDVGRIVVMTFTDAAAAEMKEKLLKILYERIRQGGNREHLLKNVKKLPLARISTIDSFCNRLYRTYFERLGLTPDFTLLDADEDEALFRRAATEVLAEAAEGTEAEISLLQRYTLNQKLDTLLGYLTELWRFSAAKPDPDVYLRDAAENAEKILDFDLAEKRKRAARLRAKAEALAADIAQYWQKGWGCIATLLTDLERVTAAVTYRDYINARILGPKTDLPKDRNRNEIQQALCKRLGVLRDGYEALWPGELIPCIDDELFEREAEALQDVETLAGLTRKALSRYRAEKEEENVASFADVEHVALRLLNDPEVLAEVRAGIDRVFVDEYQDTNGLQEAILNRLSGKDLFLVGDVKQSIYRFRFAEPRLFLERRRLFGDGGGDGSNVDLNCNFRSEPEILDFVNRVMNEVMVPDFGGVDYRREAQLQAGLKSTGTAETEIFFYEPQNTPNGETLEIYSVRDANRVPPPSPVEGEYVAQKILRLVKEGKVSKGGKLCPVEYGDIAVLTKTHAISDLTAVFDKYDIPYCVIDDGKGGESDEVRQTWNLIRVLDNAEQDIPLASVMMAFWEFGEGDLMRLNHKNGFAYGALCAPAPAGLEERLGAFRAELNRYRTRARFLGVDEIVTEVMRETGYDARVAAVGTQALGTLNAFLYCMQTHKYRRNLSAFLQNAATLSIPTPTSGNANAVRFMTIHKSKGLEFPVVFVAHAHLGYESKRVVENPMIADSEWGIAIRHRRDYMQRTTARYLALVDKRAKEEKEELLRLMYVALTRARSKLFISGRGKKSVPALPENGISFVDWVQYACQNDAALARRLASDPFAYPVGEAQRVEVAKEVFTAPLDVPYAHQGGVGLANKYAVSALEKFERDDKTPISAYLGAQKAETGTAYHLIMEKLDFDRRTVEEIERLKAEYAALPGVERVDADVLQKALAHPIFDLAAAHPCRREASFMLFSSGSEISGEDTDEDVLVQGVADLIIDTPDGAVLVDYKVSGAPEEVLKERYARQIFLYSRALEECGTPVIGAYLVVLNRSLVIKMR